MKLPFGKREFCELRESWLRKWISHTLLGAGKTRSDTSYYMSSLQSARAMELLGYIRGHWSIENRCH